MKYLSKITLSLLLTLLVFKASAQNVLISEDLSQTADQSSILDIQSSDKGILIPRMTIIERDLIVQPADGLLVFCTDDDTFYYWKSDQWVPIQGETITGFTITGDGNQKQSITSDGINSSTINAKGSLYVNYDSNDDDLNDAFIIRGKESGDDPTNYDFKISEGYKLLSDKPLVFDNGIAQNLVSQYLVLSGNYDAENKYVAIKTNIPFENNAMMSSLKISYWTYNRSYDLTVGWYTYATSFWSPNAYISGFLGSGFTTKDLYLANENGKATIYIPHKYFGGYGNISVSSSTSAIAMGDDWYKDWSVENVDAVVGENQKNVVVNAIDGDSNFANADLSFLGNRTHNLNGNSLKFDDISSFTVQSANSNWNAQFKQNDPLGAGVLISHATNSPGKHSFNVMNNTDLSRSAFVIKGDGRVGIGTNTPAGLFQIVGNSSGAIDMGILNESSALTAMARIRLGTRPGYDKGGALSFLSTSNTLEFSNTGDPNGAFTFVSRQGASKVSRMIIKGDGKVGIGIYNVLEKLHVKGNALFESEGAGWFPSLKFDVNSDAGGVSIEAYRSDDINNKRRYIALNPLGGNVGIGIIDPISKLHVNGFVRGETYVSEVNDNMDILLSKNSSTTEKLDQFSIKHNMASVEIKSLRGALTIGAATKVNIKSVLKLEPQVALPAVANSQLGDMCVFDSKLYFFNGVAWKEVQLQ